MFVSVVVSGVFLLVILMKKDIYGNVLFYMLWLKFVDGLVVSDLFIECLMYLYDVNFIVVS